MDQVKILYVEDEPFLGKIVQESLESRSFAVKMISDGAQAVSAFNDYRPHICILDVMLPNKDGFTVGKEIRQLHPTIPIIFLTARDQTQDLLEGFASGGNDYIRKPFSMEELIVRIRNLLRLSANQPQPAPNHHDIPIGRYRFSPQRFELSLDDKTQKLSHREVELLKIMIRHRNYTIRRKDILKQIWGDDTFFNSRNLDVYIKKLRDYLKDDPQVRIVTLKGVGYHFSVD